MNEIDEVEIISPPVADESDDLEFGLTALTQAISYIEGSKVAHGFLGGEFGYGADFENDVFMMHHFCWCEAVDCLWCMIWLSNETDCSELEAQNHRANQERQVKEKYGNVGYRAPNFWHKRTGLAVYWYKWIGRDMEIHNPNNADIRAVMLECMDSVAAVIEAQPAT